MHIYAIKWPSEEFEDVWKLTHDAYVAAGYAMRNDNGILRHYAWLDDIPETDVVVARNTAGQLIGTNSLTEDNWHGLHVDSAFKTETDVIRHECKTEGKRLGASWRIVTREDFRNCTCLLVGLIVKTAELAFVKRNLDVLLYTLNPRHEFWYRRRLGFERIAGPVKDTSVHNAQAVLLRGNRTETEYCLMRLQRRLETTG